MIDGRIGGQCIEGLALPEREQWSRVRSGSHSVVHRTHLNGHGGPVIIKEIRKKFPSAADISALGRDVVEYANRLNRCGVATPQPIAVFPVIEGDTCYLTTVDPFVGDDLEVAITSGEREVCLRAVDDLLEVLLRLSSRCTEPDGCELEVGIDPKPANFTRDDSGAVHYVDLMPPRWRKNGYPMVEYPAPRSEFGQQVAYFRHYDLRGLLVVLRTQLCRLRPTLRPLFVERLQAFTQRLPGEVARYHTSFAGTRFSSLDRQGRLALIGKLTDGQIYEMRDIACQLAYEQTHNHGAADGFLEQVFHLTHFYDDVPDRNQMDRARELLAQTACDRLDPPS
ncbi:MAG: hypothetical protein HY566_03795 [Candidatus Kerfeldbacteria bacterium]|nr:hypothetical protein [Candidatus Kerfeldbacteria bacterium]